MPIENKRIAVVGSGIAGLSTAWLLHTLVHSLLTQSLIDPYHPLSHTLSLHLFSTEMVPESLYMNQNPPLVATHSLTTPVATQWISVSKYTTSPRTPTW